jgi:MFS family permease
MPGASPVTARAGGTGSALTLLTATMAVLAAANSVVFALLADLRAEFDLPGWSLGTMTGAAFATGLVVQLFVAPLADRGHARRLLVVALTVAVAGNVLFLAGSSLPPFLVARALAGVSFGCFGPAARALAAAAGPADETARRLGRIEAANIGGFTVGPVVGSVLGQHFGVRVPFAVFGVLAFVALVLVAPRPLPPLPRAGSTRPSLTLVRHRPVLVALALSVTLFLPVGIYDALWAQYLKDRGASTTFVGVSLAAYTLPFVLFSSFGGRLADRFGPRRVALTGTALSVPFVLLYGLVREPWAIAGVSLVESVIGAATVPAAAATMALAAPVGRAASAQGLSGAGQQAAAAVVALTIAPLYSSARPWFVFALASALMAAGWVATAAVAARVPAAVRAPDGVDADPVRG